MNCDSLEEILEKYDDWPTLKEFYETKETLIETLETKNTITNDELTRIEAAYNQGEPSNQLIICQLILTLLSSVDASEAMPERTCEELGQCEMPAPPSTEERSTALLITLTLVPLIGLIVLISVLVFKARKSKQEDNSSNDRGGIRNPSDSSDEFSLNDPRVGGILNPEQLSINSQNVCGLIEGPEDWGILREVEVKGGVEEVVDEPPVRKGGVEEVVEEIPPRKGGVVEISEDEEVELPLIEGVYKEILLLRAKPEVEHIIKQPQVKPI